MRRRNWKIIYVKFMKAFDEIETLWNERKTLSFPSELVGEELAGICVTSLDTFTSGCIDTFVNNKGFLDNKRVLILKQCKTDLMIVIQYLKNNPTAYFKELLSLTNKVLQTVEGR